MRFYTDSETAVELELPVYRLHDYFSEGLIRACVKRSSFDFDVALQFEPDDISALLKFSLRERYFIRNGLQAHMEVKEAEPFGIHVNEIEDMIGRELEFFDSNVDWEALYIRKPQEKDPTSTIPFDVRNYRNRVDTDGNLHWYEFETFSGDSVLLFKGSATNGQLQLMWKDIGVLKQSDNGTEVPAPLVFSEEEIRRFKDVKYWEEEGPHYKTPPARKDELSLLIVRLANEHLHSNGRKPTPADLITAFKEDPGIEFEVRIDGMGRKKYEINGVTISDRALSDRLATYYAPG